MNRPVGPSWTPEATGIVERACAYYGGVDRFRSLRTIRLVPGRMSGLLPWLKGAGRTFPLPAAFAISPHERIARFEGYPDPRHVGIFHDGAVRIERLDDGSVVSRPDSHRDSFRGFAKNRRWTSLDALYFFGYALTHYHSLPFSLFDARLIRTRVSGPGRDRPDVLEVELPADLPTHCQRQVFHFDRSGCLVRHDYRAEIVGSRARGAHFWNRQVSIDGFPLAMERLVLARLGSTPFPLTALCATFVSAEIERT